MNNPWAFGWDAVAAIFGILAFVGFVVVEWDRVRDNHAIPNLIPFLLFSAFGLGIGYAIAQILIVWRIIGLVGTSILGAFFGASFSDPYVYKGLLMIHLFGSLLGIAIGLLLTV